MCPIYCDLLRRSPTRSYLPGWCRHFVVRKDSEMERSQERSQTITFHSAVRVSTSRSLFWQRIAGCSIFPHAKFTCSARPGHWRCKVMVLTGSDAACRTDGSGSSGQTRFDLEIRKIGNEILFTC